MFLDTLISVSFYPISTINGRLQYEDNAKKYCFEIKV